MQVKAEQHRLGTIQGRRVGNISNAWADREKRPHALPWRRVRAGAPAPRQRTVRLFYPRAAGGAQTASAGQGSRRGALGGDCSGAERCPSWKTTLKILIEQDNMKAYFYFILQYVYV